MIYQVHVGRWSPASQIHHKGKVFQELGSVAWSKLAQLGFTRIYLLGIFDNIGPILVDQEEGVYLAEVEHRMPSPFAIRDHRLPHPELGSVTELKSLIQTIQDSGLEVILDFVPNHRGLGHTWLETRPGYFAKTETGKTIREFSGDVVKLDYGNQELRQQMVETMATIASWGADGVRVDMAHLIPIDFWQDSIREIKRDFSSFEFLAEAYPDSPLDLGLYQDLVGAGFDYVYHGVLFQNLGSVIQSTDNLVNLVAHLEFILNQPFADHLVNYFANHDDFLERLDSNLEALLALILFLPGESLVYNGSLQGLTRRLAHHYYQEVDLEQTELDELSKPLARIFELFKQNPSRIRTITLTDSRLLRLETQELVLYLNLTQEDQELGAEDPSARHIHPDRTDTIVAAGEVEIFRIS